MIDATVSAHPGISPAEQAGAGSSSMRSIRNVVREPFSRRSWLRLGYLLATAPLSIVGFVLMVASLAVGVLLSITFVGLPIVALGGLAVRRLTSLYRQLTRVLLKEQIAGPARLEAKAGFLGWLQSALRDPASWRARAYVLIRLPLTVVSLGVVLIWAEGLFWMVYPIWWQLTGLGGPLPWLPLGKDTWAGALLVSACGLAVFAGAPWAVRAVVALDQRLVHRLLGATTTAERVRHLEHVRTQIVDDAATTLRRIERDLHDGTQAQLATLAMNLGQAKEKLEHHAGVAFDPAGALGLVDTAHRQAKEALLELRDIARGIHPPALDVGLDAALATLAARSAVPAVLRADIPTRPSQAIETIAYFSVAELLANAAKHSQARQVAVDVTGHDGRLHLTIRDDGIGGAAIGSGSGLTGLADRVASVDGSLDVTSPPGGPTTVSVELPLST